VLLKVVAQGLLGTGHHQHPLVFVLTAVDDRHHVADAVQIREQHLALGARILGHELHRRLLAGGVLRLEHGAEAAIPDAGADGPLLIQCQSHGARCLHRQLLSREGGFAPLLCSQPPLTSVDPCCPVRSEPGPGCLLPGARGVSGPDQISPAAVAVSQSAASASVMSSASGGRRRPGRRGRAPPAPSCPSAPGSC
jgi:hypothetical protein